MGIGRKIAQAILENKDNVFCSIPFPFAETYRTHLTRFLFLLYRAKHHLVYSNQFRILSTRIHIDFYDADQREWFCSIRDEQWNEIHESKILSQSRERNSVFYPKIKTDLDFIQYVCNTLQTNKDFRFRIEYRFEDKSVLLDCGHETQIITFTPTQLRFEERNYIQMHNTIRLSQLALLQEDNDEDDAK